MIISEVDLGDFIEQIHSIVGNLIDPAAQLIATARLDDDDALNPSFVKKVDQSMIPDRGNRVITFPNGCYVRLVPMIAVQRIRYRLVSAGLTYVCSPDRFQTIYDLGSHEDVGGKNEVFEDTSPWKYAMSANPSCDTGRELKTPDASLTSDFLREYTFLSH